MLECEEFSSKSHSEFLTVQQQQQQQQQQQILRQMHWIVELSASLRTLSKRSKFLDQYDYKTINRYSDTYKAGLVFI